MARTATRLEHLLELLNKQGFFHAKKDMQSMTMEHSSSYMFGHAGALFRRNLIQEWWNSMVVRQNSVYVVEDSQCSTDLDGSNQQTVSQVGLSHFSHNLEVNHRKLPLTIVQVSETTNHPSSEDIAFTRNPRKCVLLSQQFVAPSSADKTFDQCQRSRLKWWRKFSSNGSKFTISELHTSRDDSPQVHLQYEAPWGPVTVETVSSYSDTVLTSLEQTTRDTCQVKQNKKVVTPCVVESEMTLERAMLAYLADAYDEQTPTVIEKLKSDANTTRQFLSLHHRLSPYKVSISVSKFSTSVKDLRLVADHVVKELRTAGIHVLDPPENTSLEARYALCDQLGVPFTVVIKESTLNDGMVHVRNRDTTLAEKVHITALKTNLIQAIRCV